MKIFTYDEIKKRGCSFLLSLNKWMQDRPLILSFILSSSCLLFSFLLIYVGDKIPKPFTLTYYDSEGHIRLKTFGYILTVACIVWTFLLQASEKYYQYKGNQDILNAESKSYIIERVDTRIVAVCNSKYNTLISMISNVVSGKEKAKYIISKPCEQLKTITREMARCLRSLLMHGGYSLDENEMYVSIFYKFHTVDKWRQARSEFPETGLSIDDVTSNEASTFSHVLKNKNGIIFINDKQEGYNSGQYIPDKDDKYDDNGKLKGSILCYRIICQKDGIDYIEAVLSISTYDKKIEPSNLPGKVKNTQDNICQYILQAFEKRIKIELCLVYLSELCNMNKKSSVKKAPKIRSRNEADISNI